MSPSAVNAELSASAGQTCGKTCIRHCLESVTKLYASMVTSITQTDAELHRPLLETHIGRLPGAHISCTTNLRIDMNV